jgi:hypothetical protein
VLGAFAFFWAGVQAQNGDKQKLPMQAEQAKEAVTKHLEKIEGLKSNPTVAWLDDKALAEVFPDLSFIAVRYRQYPLAFVPPKGLSSSNVFAVTKEGKHEVLTSRESLEKFFAAKVKAAKAKVTDKNAGTYARAWMNLWQELVQDGFYKFQIQPGTVEKNDNTISVTAQSMVLQGGKGHLQVRLDFDAAGGVKIKPESKVMAGPRPICQATKLLDTDPIVHHMAVSELLFMGLAAKDYLLEQRAKATNPRLQQAIDRMLHRIEAIGW